MRQLIVKFTFDRDQIKILKILKKKRTTHPIGGLARVESGHCGDGGATPTPIQVVQLVVGRHPLPGPLELLVHLGATKSERKVTMCFFFGAGAPL